VHPYAAARAATHRHRRPLAAAAAALAVVAAIGALRGAPTAPAAVDSTSTAQLRTGEVAVPVSLASPAIAATVKPGDVVDVVAVPDDFESRPRVLAARVRALDQVASGGFGATATSIVLLAVPEAAALALSAGVGRALTVVIRSR